MFDLYRITCLPTGRMYVGSSTQRQRRLQTHRWALRAGRHENSRLQRAWNKHGEAAFVFEHTACAFSRQDLEVLEQAAIEDVLRQGLGFNMNLDVLRPRLGTKMPQAAKDSLSKARRGVPLGPEKLARRRELMAGLPNPMQGRVHTEETKARISEKVRAAQAEPGYTRKKTVHTDAFRAAQAQRMRDTRPRLNKGKPVCGTKDGETRRWLTTIACAKDLGCDVSYPSQRVGTGKTVKGWLLVYEEISA